MDFGTPSSKMRVSNPALEAEARAWIEAVVGEPLGAGSLQAELKSGATLCRVAEALKPGSVGKVSSSSMPFVQMENISLYLSACTGLGVPAFESFQTVDLFEGKNMHAVVTNIHALGRAAQRLDGWCGPVLGAKMASANPRSFTEEQLSQAKAAPTLMGLGSSAGASQAGCRVGDRIVRTNLDTVGFGVGGEPTLVGTGNHGASKAGAAPTNGGRLEAAAATPTNENVSNVEAVSGAAPKHTPSKCSLGGGAAPGAQPVASAADSREYVRYEDRASENGSETVLYGMDRELAQKAKAKYNPALEAEARAWIEAVVGEPLGAGSLQAELKSGAALCRVAEALKPGSVGKVSSSSMPFVQMENISRYLSACTGLGVPAFESFQTVDLFEGKNMHAVVTNIHALGRAAQRLDGWCGPVLGAKMASANPRSFTEEQLSQAKAAPTLMSLGSSAGAIEKHLSDR